MYKLIDSGNIWGRKQAVAAGYPEDMTPDLCFINDNFPSRITEINSKVLIEALLNSTELLQSLGYKFSAAVDSGSDGEEHTENVHLVDGVSETLAAECTTPPLADGTAQDDASAKKSDNSLAQDSAVPKREYSPEEKQILTAARKSYQRETQCSYDAAKKHVAEHAEEYIAAHYAELTPEVK